MFQRRCNPQFSCPKQLHLFGYQEQQRVHLELRGKPCFYIQQHHGSLRHNTILGTRRLEAHAHISR